MDRELGVGKLRIPIGTGLAKGAKNINELHPQWMMEFADGTTALQFKEWLKEKGINVPNIPR